MKRLKDNPYEKLLIAINNQELDAYLIGAKDYYFANKWIEEPTDLKIVFDSINEYARSYGDKVIKQMVAEAMIKLAKDPIGCWWDVMIFYTYNYRFLTAPLLFNILTDQLIVELSFKLNEHKSILINNREWVGNGFENGLWQQIVEIVPKINEVIDRGSLKERIKI